MLVKVFGLVGMGGFSREVMPFLDRGDFHPNNLYYVTDVEQNNSATLDKGSIFQEQFFQINGTKYFNVAIANSNVRRSISELFVKKGCIPKEIFGYNCHVGHRVKLGKAAILCTNTILTCDITVGDFFHCNMNSYIAHDCHIGDFVTFAPNVSCNGNIEIHDFAYIGTGAVLKQGTASKKLVIGEGAVIGMGAVVTKDVEPYTTVVGNPARELLK
jgi:sugar O-acyltransferase (sialic acid O-acetyltransferase NeuD family)